MNEKRPLPKRLNSPQPSGQRDWAPAAFAGNLADFYRFRLQ